MGSEVPGREEQSQPVSSIPEDQTDGPTGVTDGSTVARPGRGLPSTRASRAWVKVLPAIMLLVIMLVFVLQNLHRAKVSFLGLSGTLPLAVSLLAAAALGGLFVLALGSVRILQLRRVIRDDRRTSSRRPS
jgi:uncharacterized integral membrane protein